MPSYTKDYFITLLEINIDLDKLERKIYQGPFYRH
jgi:hypothetical protein